MSNIKKRILAAAKGCLGVFALVTGLSSYYIVDQTEHAVITEFGKPVKVVLNPLKRDKQKMQELREAYEKEGLSIGWGAGLKFKLPYIQQVGKINRMLLRWNGFPEEIPTKDKKYIWVDTTARWYIEDPLTFLRTTGTEDQAQARLDDIIDSTTRNSITKRDLIEIVRSDNREISVAEEELRETIQLGTVTEGRQRVIDEIISTTQGSCNNYGIKICEAGILAKGLNYVESVKVEVENRMIAERERIAKKYISEGEGEFNRIMGEKEKRLKEISSQAYKKSREIEGEADATATNIYAKGFGKNKDFYRFIATLDLYEKTLGEKTRLILGTDNPLLDLIKGEVSKYNTSENKK